MFRKPKILAFIVLMAFILLPATGVTAAEIKFVYYENEANQIIKANNTLANFTAGDMLTKLIEGYRTARDSQTPKRILFETPDGRVFDWGANIQSGAFKSWPEIQTGQSVSAPLADFELDKTGNFNPVTASEEFKVLDIY